jgi:hypothetical protein
MAKITDPDSLALDVNGTPTTEEVAILTGAKTIELRVAGNLDDTAPGKTSGVTGKALYSFLKEEWLNGTDAAILRRFKFPIQMIFEGSFIFTNGWAPANVQTRDLFRDAGFQESVSSDIYACNISLKSIDAPGADQAYYTQAQGFTASPVDYDKTGELNENIDITGADTYLKAFLREQGKVYDEYELLGEFGISVIGFQAYAFPLSNEPDLKVSASDATIDTTTPYTNMEINFLKGSGFTTWADSTVYPVGAVVQALTGRWFFSALGGTSSGTDVGDDVGVTDWTAYFGEEQIGANYYAFNREIDAATGTEIQAHELAQRELRQAGDINDDTGITAGQGTYGTVNGKVARKLSTFIGDNLFLEPGVVLRNFDANATNRIKHQPITVDSGGLDADDVPLIFTTVAFPFVAAGTFQFSQNLVDQPDVDTVYTVYFDWITQDISTGIAITGSSGSDATIDWSADAGLLDHLANNDYFYMDGFTAAGDNGLWQITGTPSSNTVTATKQDGATAVDEAASNSITGNLNPFESPLATIVKDDGATDMDAQITAASIAWDFDYTNNVQGGRTANQDAPCTLVAIAKDGAEWILANFTITAATGITVPVNAGDERNYENP